MRTRKRFFIIAVILIIIVGISICIAYFLHQKYAAEDTEDSLNVSHIFFIKSTPQKIRKIV